jgi:hypothetical protein
MLKRQGIRRNPLLGQRTIPPFSVYGAKFMVKKGVLSRYTVGRQVGTQKKTKELQKRYSLSTRRLQDGSKQAAKRMQIGCKKHRRKAGVSKHLSMRVLSN